MTDEKRYDAEGNEVEYNETTGRYEKVGDEDAQVPDGTVDAETKPQDEPATPEQPEPVADDTRRTR